MSETTKTPRAHADLAIKFYSDTNTKCWRWSEDFQEWLYIDTPHFTDDRIYEVSETKPTYKPKKRVTLAGITLNAPESVAPEPNTRYWIPQPVTVGAIAYECYWVCSEFDREYLENGFVHLKEEDAKLHAEALIKLSKELK